MILNSLNDILLLYVLILQKYQFSINYCTYNIDAIARRGTNAIAEFGAAIFLDFIYALAKYCVIAFIIQIALLIGAILFHNKVVPLQLEKNS